MRHFAALVPCLLACACNHATALHATSALARLEVTAPPVAARDRAASDAHAAARLTPPFHAASASVRRLDTASPDAPSAKSDASADEQSAALGPLADARRAP